MVDEEVQKDQEIPETKTAEMKILIIQKKILTR